MDRFEKLFSKNDVEKGGSFYLQSKIYFAKEFLMQDHPSELNVSRYNPSEEQSDDEHADEEKAEGEEKDGETKEEESDSKPKDDSSDKTK
jgi:hypothetical protein